jgi:NADPH:quinone reductase-like Zn-dependent oxidoreductase
MKAIVYERYGPPEVLRLEEAEKPVPGDEQVLVEVRAASVNSWDWDLLRGVPSLLRLGKPQYRTLGADIAGRVEEVGRSVTLFRPGDEVFGDLSGCGWGGFAEYACAAEHALAPKPAGLTFEQAAAVPQAGVLALQGLRDRGRLQSGRKALINGAGGGVGTFAVQLAKSFGAEVTAVDSAGKLDLLRSIGADHVIDYAEEDFTRNGRRYDLILDMVASRSAFDYALALNPGGTCVLVGGPMTRLLLDVLLGPWMSLAAKKKIALLIHKPNRQDLLFLTELLEAGKIVPVIDKRYPLREVPEALRHLGEGRARGKVVIAVAPAPGED